MLAGILAFVALEFSVVAAKAIIANGALLAAKLGVDLTTVSFISLGSAIKQSLGIIGLAAAAFGLLIAIFGKSGAPIAGVIAGITAIGAAFIFANAASGIFGVAMLLLSTIFHMTQSPPFYELFGYIALGIIAMALALVFVQSVSMPVILALTAMAFGLSAMFYAISLLIDSMTAFFDLMLQNITLLPQLAMNLYTLVPAFMALGGALMYAGLGFGTFAAGALAAALVLAGGSIVFLGAAVAMAPLVAEIFLLGEGFEKMGNGIEKISKALQLVSAITGGGEESFFALSSDGTQTSIVAAKGGMLKTFSSDKLTVDVKMPEINVPQPIVHVYIDGKEVSHSVKSMLGRDTGAG